MSEDLRAAVAAGVVGSRSRSACSSSRWSRWRARSFAPRHRRSSCSTRTRTSSCSRRSPATGAETLLGKRFPSSTGIAGWVLVTRQPLVIEDVTEDPRFAKGFAETTGYVPKG